MKTAKLYILFALFIYANLFLAKISYSQWEITGTAPNIGAFPTVSVVNQNTAWIGGGTSGNSVLYRTTNGGINWSSIPTTGIQFEIYALWAIDANVAFVGNSGSINGGRGNAKFYKTTNAGNNWTLIDSTGGTAGFFNGIVFSKTMPSFGIAMSDCPNGAGQPFYVSKTTDGGNTWLATHPPGIPPVTGGTANSVFVIDNLFYGWGCFGSAPPAVILTTDGGITFNRRNSSLSSVLATPGAAFKDDKLTGIVATNSSIQEISRTTNGGLNWVTISVSPDAMGRKVLNWISGTNTCFLNATAGGIKKSTDGGIKWSSMTTSGIVGVRNMGFSRVGTNLYGYAITNDEQVLKLTEMIIGVTSINGIVPSGYTLGQNYPNPFNPVTNMEFGIIKLGFVSLKVYDVLGKEVATLVNERLSPGTYKYDFDGSNFSSGVYFYKLEADGFADTKKMFLVK